MHRGRGVNVHGGCRCGGGGVKRTWWWSVKHA